MDPLLFEFADELSEQHQEEQGKGEQESKVILTSVSGGGGESATTTSIPGGTATTTTPAVLVGQQEQVGSVGCNPQQVQGQMAGSGSSTPFQQQQQPLVRVVTGKSEDNQQVYVIKLENLFQQPSTTPEEGSGGGVQWEGDGTDGGGPFENGNVEGGGGGEGPQNLSSDEEDGGDRKSGEEEEDDGPDPFLVVSPEAVMAMAQSVGVDLNEDDASELGCLTTNKLRQAVLVAMRFSQNENSAGITAEQFSKAEKQLGSVGFGNESVFRDMPLKYVGGVSVADDGPEIDLYATVSKNCKESRQFTVDIEHPILHVQRIHNYESNTQSSNRSSNFNLYGEPVVSLISEDVVDIETDEGQGEQQQDQSQVIKMEEGETEAGGSQNIVGSEENANSDKSNNEPSSQTSANGDDDIGDDEIVFPEEIEADEIVDELFSDSISQAGEPINQEGQQSTGDVGNDGEGEGDKDIIAPEWAAYLEVMLKLAVTQNYKQGLNYKLSSEFKLVLDDARRNGAQPIFHLICDSFRDYLRNPNTSLASIVNMLAIVDALVTSNCEPTLVQMTDLGSVLIEIIILPPPSEVHHLVTNTFMKILTTCNELLTWTCTYVTEMLKGIGETPMIHFHDPFKCTMHGALCLANGLEEINIQVAQEFGWHTSVLNFSRNHSTVFDGQSYCLTEQDSYLEEEILKFYYNFLNNYTGLVVPAELSNIRDTVTTMYGERFLSFLVDADSGSAKRTKYNNSSKTKTRCVYSKITYKNREVILPCRKLLK